MLLIKDGVTKEITDSNVIRDYLVAGWKEYKEVPKQSTEPQENNTISKKEMVSSKISKNKIRKFK